MSHNRNPVLRWSTQNHASRIKKADIRNYFWLGASLANLHLPESVLSTWLTWTGGSNLTANRRSWAPLTDRATRFGYLSTYFFDPQSHDVWSKLLGSHFGQEPKPTAWPHGDTSPTETPRSPNPRLRAAGPQAPREVLRVASEAHVPLGVEQQHRAQALGRRGAVEVTRVLKQFLDAFPPDG